MAPPSPTSSANMASKNEKPQGNKIGTKVSTASGERPPTKKPLSEADLEKKREKRRATKLKHREAVERGEKLTYNAFKRERGRLRKPGMLWPRMQRVTRLW
ncbi:hypothetical protein BDZ45DRAFT_751698 [Acephala macrosclerotiorum]|nr:hypothetical protein BDZ45DRAFT_751698 [Acephala macrosclerotiorum]